jgi:hypothetical protein
LFIVQVYPFPSPIVIPFQTGSKILLEGWLT